jgi:hypothetical protein
MVPHSSLLSQRLTFAWATQVARLTVLAWCPPYLSQGPNLSRKHFVVRIEMGLAVEAYWPNLPQSEWSAITIAQDSATH